MWTNQDEMFADETESDEKQRFFEKDIDENAIEMLDDLAMRIADGDVTVHHISRSPAEPEIRRMDKPTLGINKLEVEYEG